MSGMSNAWSSWAYEYHWIKSYNRLPIWYFVFGWDLWALWDFEPDDPGELGELLNWAKWA